jgi:multidrug resistance efflux pump
MNAETTTLPDAAPAGARLAPPGPEGAAPPRTRRRPPRLVLLLGALLLLAVAIIGSLVWEHAQPPGLLVASGTLELDEVLVGPEVSGRLVALRVDEGQTVRAGDELARLDDSLIQLQISQADPASRRQLEIQATHYVLTAPSAGIVTRVPVRVGELISPGQVVAAVADPRWLKLTLYVPESDLGRVRVGQPVEIQADPFPSRVFNGKVTSINTSAEFTPRNVQTQKDRLNLVFGVKVSVDNRDGALKAGLPVDATFLEGS